MTDFLVYDLKVAALIIVFYLFYRLMLSHETFHRVNRIVLLLTAVASFLLPLCVFTMHKTVVLEALPEISIGDAQMVVEPEPPMPWWQVALPIVYFTGMLMALGHTSLSILKVMTLIRRSERHPQPDGTTICVTGNAKMAPFSWMHYIVMNRGDYEAEDAAILAHERGHIRLRHSYDLLLVDLLTALQWFNPAMWMLRQDLRAIHEYEADGEVLSQGINARQYQYLLISKAADIGGYSIVNGINHSTLKKRIHMMINMKSKSSHLLKLLALLPIIGAALALNARTVTDYVYDGPQKQHPIKKGKAKGKINLGSANVIEVVEQETTSEEGQTFKISGVVKDKENGAPIVGAIIKIGHSDKGTVTDMNGEFSIDVKKGDTVAAAYIGYASDVTVVNEPGTGYVFTLKKDGSDEDEGEFLAVEQMPQYPGGPAAMMQFLMKNVHYPDEAYKNNVQGRVIVTFVIEKDGSITEATVAKAVHPMLDAEALRVVNSMPKWTPGMQKGEAVRVRYTIPVTFKLAGKDDTDEMTVVSGNTQSDDNAYVEAYLEAKEKESPQRIRYEGTVTYQNDAAHEPYFVVDGKPMSADKVKEIVPNSIEQITVLKDKTAVELYGEKGRQGVVVITTKKSK